MAGALLRLRGLPFSSDAQAVRDFFASFHCQDVQLLVGRNGECIPGVRLKSRALENICMFPRDF